MPTAQDELTIASSIETLEELCRDYLELEEIMEAPLARKYPPIYDVAGLPPEQAAETVALEERNRLGLGDGPIPILRYLLEQDVGFRLFYLPLPPRFSEMYVYDDALGRAWRLTASTQRSGDAGQRRTAICISWLIAIRLRLLSNIAIGDSRKVSA